MAEKIRKGVDEQAPLGQTLGTEIITVRYADLVTLGAESGHPNARYMKPAMFRRLVDNIRHDGCLTSLPLVAHIQGESPLFVCSGNHRVEAAIQAGLESGQAIKITVPLTRDRFVAIQLAHNAVEGEDDPTVLKGLYDSLGLDLKEYCGLTDEAFEADEMSVTTLAGVSALYQDVTIAFIGDDAQAVKDFLDRAGKLAKKEKPVYVAHYADFGVFFDTLVRTKKVKTAINTAVALRLMVDIANAELDRLENAVQLKANLEASMQPSTPVAIEVAIEAATDVAA